MQQIAGRTKNIAQVLLGGQRKMNFESLEILEDDKNTKPRLRVT